MQSTTGRGGCWQRFYRRTQMVEREIKPLPIPSLGRGAAGHGGGWQKLCPRTQGWLFDWMIEQWQTLKLVQVNIPVTSLDWHYKVRFQQPDMKVLVNYGYPLFPYTRPQFS